MTLDRLSGGRLTLGLGTGGDAGGEYSAFGEEPNSSRLGDILDEGAAVLSALWAGDKVDHRGLIRAEGVQLLPRPVQQPRIPMWFGTARTTGRPIQRAARFDGVFPIDVDAGGIARIAEAVRTIRGSLDGFDIAAVSRRAPTSA
ncbi:LLM class flavin-dependent oxidoreductase [Mycolicibacterium sp. Dal123E01]|uniref:LLM class flavin-dependent oxidoreductase n=1 Tax=Mycolicibacterium sp. Dal123E01 TaxID=3457578 RepID=UPI00403EC581